MRRRALVVALGALTAASAASAVDISLQSAWMRPAAAGSTAKAYIDIASNAALQLAHAETPLADRVDIVIVARSDGSDPGTVVASHPVAKGGLTRFAFLGNHLRLSGIRAPLVNGNAVPLTLEFRDDDAIAYVVFARIEVRGLISPRADGAPKTR